VHASLLPLVRRGKRLPHRQCDRPARPDRRRCAAPRAGRPGRRLSRPARPVRALLAAGLVDELNLFLHPLVVGTGQRLFADGADRLPLTLTHSATFSTGVLHLVYTP